MKPNKYRAFQFLVIIAVGNLFLGVQTFAQKQTDSIESLLKREFEFLVNYQKHPEVFYKANIYSGSVSSKEELYYRDTTYIFRSDGDYFSVIANKKKYDVETLTQLIKESDITNNEYLILRPTCEADPPSGFSPFSRTHMKKLYSAGPYLIERLDSGKSRMLYTDKKIRNDSALLVTETEVIYYSDRLAPISISYTTYIRKSQKNIPKSNPALIKTKMIPVASIERKPELKIDEYKYRIVFSEYFRGKEAKKHLPEWAAALANGASSVSITVNGKTNDFKVKKAQSDKLK